MTVGEYMRTPKGVGKIVKTYQDKQDSYIYLDSGITIDYITKDFTKDEINKMYPSSPNIIDLIDGGDLMYIDISPDNSGGIVVPRVAETQYELDKYKELLNSERYILKGIVTYEQLFQMEYKVGGNND